MAGLAGRAGRTSGGVGVLWLQPAEEHLFVLVQVLEYAGAGLQRDGGQQVRRDAASAPVVTQLFADKGFLQSCRVREWLLGR